MTVAEYLKKRRRLENPLFLASALSFLGGGAGYLLCPARWHADRLVWFIVGFFVVGLVTVFVSEHLAKKLVDQHPEMTYLDKWVRVMGTADKFPIDGAVKVDLIPELAKKLEVSARLVNIAIDARDRMVETMKGHKEGSVARGFLQAGYDNLASMAESQNKKYLAEWNLCVEKLQILSGPDYFDPRRYREGLVWEKV